MSNPRTSLASVAIAFLLASVAVAGETARKPAPTLPASLEDVQPEKSLPPIGARPNETRIADDFVDVDPTFVIGALLDRTSTEVRTFDGFLRADAKPTTTVLNEILFKHFVENSLMLSADWFGFVSGQLNDKTRAEVSILKVARVTTPASALDLAKAGSFAKSLPPQDRDRYGVIIAYVDYVLTASFFRDRGREAKAGGFGVKIGGAWYQKEEATTATHRLLAIWTPLSALQAQGVEPASLEQTLRAAVSEESAKGAPLVPVGHLRRKP